jgi:putative hydrolase of HD superfamily
MAMIAMFAPASLGLDVNKCIKMSLFHDLAESVVGDITPADNVPKAEKSRRETIAIDYLTQTLLVNVDGGKMGEEIRALWHEHEESKTLESRFVQDVDKVEMLLQMMEYERRAGGAIDLSEFTYVVAKLHLPESRLWAEAIIKEREEYWREYGTILGEKGELSSDKKRMLDQYYGDNPNSR